MAKGSKRDIKVLKLQMAKGPIGLKGSNVSNMSKGFEGLRGRKGVKV